MGKKILTIICFCAVSLGVSTWVRADEWAKKYKLTGKAEVRVETSDGSVNVRAGDNDAIDARVGTSGWRIGPEGVKVIEHQTGNRVELEVHLPHFNWNMGNRSVRIDLTVPRESNLDIRTSDGDVSAEGVKGELRLSTSDGNVRATSLEGALNASTSDGTVTADGRFDRLSLKSGDGRIDAKVNPGSKMAEDWYVRSGDGDVTMRLPGNFAADLSLHTGDGHIQLGFPFTVTGTMRESDIHGKLNGGGQTLSVRTGDGSIHLEKM